ncbi:YokU family protein [Bacillus sp. B15-48]|uniref:YokU family protein n=1 Tax=Bacillus sp. B15-48 TaxID=1548601 RepID=UPI00193FC764|nr:YokU family protein [Bacillus sp. B15-48]MBM4762016.1 YokU family protein [Bacillus sp. B15-48]
MCCEWCSSKNIIKEAVPAFWELPDGTKAIEIRETPCISCNDCGMTYQEEETIEQIEEQLLLINTETLEKSLTFDELMKKPRLLKRNYFKFD